jgi:hypothetical protein
MTAHKAMKKIIEQVKKPFDWYAAPSAEIFGEIKDNAIKVWQTDDDTYGYATEKISWIKDLQNIRDNVWTIVGMFDYKNQYRLLNLSTPETFKFLEAGLKEYYKDAFSH